MEKLTLCKKRRKSLRCVWRPNGYISKRNLVSDVTSMIIDQGQQQQCLGPTKSSSWNTHINGGASAQLGLDLIEAPWLWGLSVVPPFMEVLGVTQGSSQKLRIFWPDQEASASVIGGTRRWGGESRTLEDPANFWQQSFLCSQFESWGYLHFHHFHFFMQL